MDSQNSRSRRRNRRRKSKDLESTSKETVTLKNIVKAKNQIDASKKVKGQQRQINNEDKTVKSDGAKKHVVESRNIIPKSNTIPNPKPSTSVLNVHQKKVMEKKLEKLKNEKKPKPALEKIQSNTKTLKNNIADKRLKFLRKSLSTELQNVQKPPIIETQKNKPKINSQNVTGELLKFPRNRIAFKFKRNSKKCPHTETQSIKETPIFEIPKRKCPQLNETILPEVQSMECESVDEDICRVRTDDFQNQNTTLESIIVHRPSYSKGDCNADCIIVVDTNIILSYIGFIDEIINKSDQSLVVMIPWRVFCELDNLKNSKKRTMDSGLGVDHLARRALSYLHENLPKNDKLIGQSLKEASDHIFPCETPDDEVLNCCIQKAQSDTDLILLSDDKNLCIKATVNNIKALTHDQFKAHLLNKKEKSKVTNTTTSVISNRNNNTHSKPKSDPQVENSLKVHTNVGDILKKILSVALEEEMKLCYEELWSTIVFKKPPWSLQDLLECITKHWIAVFSEIFSSDSLDIVRELQFFFPRRRKIETFSSSDLKLLVSSSTKLVQCLKRNSRKSYYKLASECCPSLSKVIDNTFDPNSLNKFVDSELKTDEKIETGDSRMESIGKKFINAPIIFNNQLSDVENQISEVFQFIWNGFTNFCSQLGNSLGVTHCLDDKVTTNPLQQLLPQADSIANQINLLIKNISRILLCNQVSETSPEYMKCEANQAADSFYSALTETIIGMGCNQWNFDRIQLFTFCSKHRDILEDGFNKFTTLHNLILECSVKYTSLQM